MKVATGIVVLAACVVAAHPSAESPRLPTPEASFGFQPGADYKLATYDQSIDYFKKLDAASKYLTLFEAGRTTQGRPMYFALISSPKNLAHIDRYREIARRLAHPADLTETGGATACGRGQGIRPYRRRTPCERGGWTSAHAAARATNCSRELESPQFKSHSRQRCPDAVADDQPGRPANGRRLVHEERRHAVRAVRLPVLYQEYVGHDNNRDAYMLNMIESRVMEHAWRQWEPQIIYVHHQSGPFPTRIWLPPFSEPVGTRRAAADGPRSEHDWHGDRERARGARPGRCDAHGHGFDAWYPGYIDYAPNFKNVAAFWTETALYQYATPHEYTLQDFPPTMRDLRPRSLYASPWPPGWWRLRDAVDYMETASWSVLEYASNKDSLLLNRYRAGREQIARGLTRHLTPTSSRRISATSSRRSSFCVGWHLVGCEFRS